MAADYWVAPVMAYYRKYRAAGRPAFLKALDRKLSADWITALSPTKRIENANAILRQIERSQSPEELCRSREMEINSQDFGWVIDGDVYGRSYARYLLLKLELLCQGNNTPLNLPAAISIEHILPQHPAADSQWRKDFTGIQQDQWTNCLGNLALIPRRKNASLGNLDFQQKMSRYFAKNIEKFASSLRVYNRYARWTRQRWRRTTKR